VIVWCSVQKVRQQAAHKEYRVQEEAARDLRAESGGWRTGTYGGGSVPET